MHDLLHKIDRRYAKVCLYASVTTLITLAAGMLLWHSAGFFTKFWELLCAVLNPLVMGALFSYILNPPVTAIGHWLARRGYHPDQGKRRRRLAVIICLALLMVLLVGLLIVFVSLINHSLSGISVDVVQQVLEALEGDFNEIISNLEGTLQEFGISSDGFGSLTDMFIGVKDFFENLFFCLIFTVYFLLDGDTVFNYFGRVLRALLGDDEMRSFLDFFADADRVFSGYLRGQVIDAAVVGTLAAVCLAVVGVPHGVLVGFLTGIGNLIPYVGGPVGYLTLVLVCLAEGQLGKLVVGLLVLSLVMLVDSNVINPRLLSENVEVHPLLVVAALIAGGAMGGIVGMLVAVPVAAFVKVKVDGWLVRHEGDSQQ